MSGWIQATMQQNSILKGPFDMVQIKKKDKNLMHDLIFSSVIKTKKSILWFLSYFF